MKDVQSDNERRIYAALEALVGTWNSSGVMPMSGDSPDITIQGTDAYEWQPGKRFMIHTADVMVGDDKVNVIEMIGGYDADKQACAMHAFQNDGRQGIMWASVQEDGSLLFSGETTRAILVAQHDSQTMDATWERLEDGAWIHWMDMHFSKRA